MIDFFSAAFSGILTIIGFITLVWVWNAKNSFTPGNLRILSSGLVATALCGVFYALWNLVINTDVLVVTESFVRETPNNLLILFFFISMMFNAFMLRKFADKYGFLKKR